jgi:hypothetical protein
VGHAPAQFPLSPSASLLLSLSPTRGSHLSAPFSSPRPRALLSPSLSGNRGPPVSFSSSLYFFPSRALPARVISDDSLASGPHAEITGYPFKPKPGTLTYPCPNPSHHRRPPAPPPLSSAAPTSSASPWSGRSAAPPTPTTPGSASPRHPEAPRAQQLGPTPLHRRDFTEVLPSVSCSAELISRRHQAFGHADPLYTSAGTP